MANRGYLYPAVTDDAADANFEAWLRAHTATSE
jgi:hypothetical protein